MTEEQKTEAPEAEHVEPEFLPPPESDPVLPPLEDPPVLVPEIVNLGEADIVTAEVLLTEAVPGLTRIGDYHLVNKIQEFLARA